MLVVRFVGTGCFLELNGSKKLENPNYAEQWLLAGDVVELEIEHLGKLSNTIVAEESDWSLLKKKKISLKKEGRPAILSEFTLVATHEKIHQIQTRATS